MKPPRVYELTTPSSHRTSSITKMVQSMIFSFRVSVPRPRRTKVKQFDSHWRRCGKISLERYEYSTLRLLVAGRLDRG